MGFSTWSASGLSAQPPASTADYSHPSSLEPEDSKPGLEENPPKRMRAACVSGSRLRMGPACPPPASMVWPGLRTSTRSRWLNGRSGRLGPLGGDRRVRRGAAGPCSHLGSPISPRESKGREGTDLAGWSRAASQRLASLRAGVSGWPCAPAGLSQRWVGRSRQVQEARAPRPSNGAPGHPQGTARPPCLTVSNLALLT